MEQLPLVPCEDWHTRRVQDDFVDEPTLNEEATGSAEPSILQELDKIRLDLDEVGYRMAQTAATYQRTNHLYPDPHTFEPPHSEINTVSDIEQMLYALESMIA